MRIKELLVIGINRLKEHKINSPQLESEIFLSEILKKPKEWLIANYNYEITNEIEEKFLSFIERRIKKEPVEYIIGKKEFYSLEFKVNYNVLIPRPETEILVDTTIEIIKKNNLKKILDIGTGSGAIAISLKKNIPKIKIVATDINIEALKLAKENSLQNKVNNILFACCDLFNGLKYKFDMIISNPPYIKTKDLKKLPQSVINFEPVVALDGGKDGLEFYKKIIVEGKNFLNPKGYMVFEIGYISIIKELKKIFSENGFYDILIKKDFSDFPRVIIAKC